MEKYKAFKNKVIKTDKWLITITNYNIIAENLYDYSDANMCAWSVPESFELFDKSIKQMKRKKNIKQAIIDVIEDYYF